MRARVATSVLLVAASLGLSDAPAVATGCHPAPYASCAGANLSGRNLSQLDLTGIDLTGADLTGTNFHGSNLSHAEMSGVRAQYADLSSVLLRHADLKNAHLVGAHLYGSQLDYADLTNAIMNRIEAAHANFAVATMAGVQGGEGHFQSANFHGTNLHGASFATAYLGHASFQHASFQNTSFIGAHISHTRVTPSNIGHDHMARFYFFQRAYTHVNAYGSSGGCSGSGGAAHEASTCNGHNDDSAAVLELSGPVRFQWSAERVNGRRGFNVEGSNHGYGVRITGESDIGLGSFYVDGVAGTIQFNPVWRTHEDAPRGHIGGPLAIEINYHRTFQSPGYSMNLSGWIQRDGVAPTTAPQ